MLLPGVLSNFVFQGGGGDIKGGTTDSWGWLLCVSFGAVQLAMA